MFEEVSEAASTEKQKELEDKVTSPEKAEKVEQQGIPIWDKSLELQIF